MAASKTHSQEVAPKDSVKVYHTETQAKTYKVRGVIKKIYREEKKITIKHEKIKGYMPAMTMTFPVSNSSILEGVEEGKRGIFTIMVYKGLPTVAGIKLSKHAKASRKNSPGSKH